MEPVGNKRPKVFGRLQGAGPFNAQQANHGWTHRKEELWQKDEFIMDEFVKDEFRDLTEQRPKHQRTNSKGCF